MQFLQDERATDGRTMEQKIYLGKTNTKKKEKEEEML